MLALAPLTTNTSSVKPNAPILLERAVRLRDANRIARCRRAPEHGPKILFFSGGSALRSTARELKRLTHNSVHLMTPFDSGGSSARLREAFDMLAVGDVRNRLMALADEGARGSPEIFELFNTCLLYTSPSPRDS